MIKQTPFYGSIAEGFNAVILTFEENTYQILLQIQKVGKWINFWYCVRNKEFELFASNISKEALNQSKIDALELIYYMTH